MKPTSTILTVNATGEIELNTIYDTPKQAVWSARGDLAFGAGISYGLIPGGVEQEQVSKTDAASISKQTVDDNGPPPALFGRGDEDGFPALGHESKAGHENNKYGPETKERESTPAENPPIQRPALRYTPSELRVYSTEHNQYINAQEQEAQATRDARHRSDSEPPTRMQEQARIRRIRHQRVSGVSSVVQNDVSMLMRTRSLRGYGLSDVCIKPRTRCATLIHCSPH